jgi:rhodanese-related sulfurtransferase
MTAQWLRQLGHEAYVLEGGIAAARGLARPSDATPLLLPRPDFIAASEVAQRLRDGSVQLIDVAPGMSYRKAHIDGAVWSIRPRIAAAVADPAVTVVLVADEGLELAALAAMDLAEAGVHDVRLLAGGNDAARAAGLPVVSTPDTPGNAECIDFLFFTHGRHDGNTEAARQYLAWEIALVDQLDAQERGSFRVGGAE